MRFYSSIADNYEYIFPYKQFKVDFIDSLFKRGSNVIDIGCAIGDISFGLSEKGHKVLGIDLDKRMIERAKQRFKAVEGLDFKVMDMTKIPSELVFDAVVSTGNTLVHLKDLETIKKFFRSLRENIVDKGKIFFQILNYEYILKNRIDELPVITNDNIRFTRKYSFSEGKVFFKTELLIKEEDHKIENLIELFPLTKDQIGQILKETGYIELEFFSDFKGTNYKKDALPIIFKATKG